MARESGNLVTRLTKRGPNLYFLVRGEYHNDMRKGTSIYANKFSTPACKSSSVAG